MSFFFNHICLHTYFFAFILFPLSGTSGRSAHTVTGVRATNALEVERGVLDYAHMWKTAQDRYAALPNGDLSGGSADGSGGANAGLGLSMLSLADQARACGRSDARRQSYDYHLSWLFCLSLHPTIGLPFREQTIAKHIV